MKLTIIYAFPQPTMTRNVAFQDPDMLFFAGDQIYESYNPHPEDQFEGFPQTLRFGD